MLEWRSDEEFPPEALPEDERRRRAPRRPRLVLGLLLAVALLGLLGLRWRLNERREAMRRDVVAFAEQEERLRRFGLRERAGELVAPDVPEAWRIAYLDTFETSGDAQPVELEVTDVSFDGNGALATLRLGEESHARYYRLVGTSWRRAPIPSLAWGAERRIELPDGRDVVFHERDRAFAERLVRDLPPLLDLVEQWPGRLLVHDIRVEPDEFGEAIVRDRSFQIAVNSPALIRRRPGEPGADSMVRLALAEALFQRIALAQDATRAIPRARSFLSAVRAVSALRWALSPTEQQRAVESWRTKLEHGWVSPFTALVDSQGQVTFEVTEQVRAAALLTADHLYRSRSPGTLAAIARSVPQAATWDEVFQAVLQQLPIMVEAQVAAEASIPGGPIAEGLARFEGSSLQAQWLRQRASSGDTVLVKASSMPHPILVDLADQTEFTSVRNVPLNCLPVQSEVDIHGDWLEVGYRLRASLISVRHLELPLSIDKAPPDTIAYLEEAEGERGQPAHLVALRSDGTTLHIGDLGRPASSVWPSFMGSTGSPALLVEAGLTDCNGTWLINADPVAGTADWWLTAQSARIQLVWRPDRDDLLLFESAQASPPPMVEQNTWQYTRLTAEGAAAISTPARVPVEFWPWGWSLATQRLVVLHQDARVGLVDLDFGQETTWYHLQGELFGLTPPQTTGSRWFAYVTRMTAHEDERYALRVLELATGTDSLVVEGAEGEVFGLSTWSHNPADERLIVAVGTGDRKDLAPVRLLALRPDQPDSVAVVAEFAEDERLISTPAVCPDGRLLYTVQKNGRLFTRLHAPGAEPLVVGKRSERPLFPLSCPGLSAAASTAATTEAD